MFTCIPVLDVNQHVACDDFREVGRLLHSSRQSSFSSVRCDHYDCETNTLVLSNDPLQKAVRDECCRGCNRDARYTLCTVIKADKSAMHTT